MSDLYELIQESLAETDELIKGRINLSIIMCGGVYLLSDTERILYIGETGCFAQRVSTHLADGRIPFSKVEVIYMRDSAVERVRLEQTLIRKFQPPYNSKGARYGVVRHGAVRNIENQYRKAGYESSLDKCAIVDPEFDE